MDRPLLYIRPQPRVFGRSKEAKFVKALDELTANALIVEPQSIDELKMNRDGTLQDGYRYTAPGLRSVCNLVCKGLYSTITDLAGLGKPASPSDISFDEAVRIYNRTIAIRWPARLADKYRIHRDVRQKLVHGVLGPKYLLLENCEVFERAKTAAESCNRAMRFHRALIVGRRLQVRFVHEQRLFYLDGSESSSFRGGLHFANSEVGGESTLRAAVLLRRDIDDSMALGPYLGGRLPHIGKSFNMKVQTVFAKASQIEHDADFLKMRLHHLQTKPLGKPTTTEEARVERFREISRRLYSLGLPMATAKFVLEEALFRGSDQDEDAGMPRMLGSGAFASRSLYDLYNSLTSHGRSLYAAAQEKLEQLAYRLLLGQIKIK